jgi:predicted nucleotidyltransferase
VATQPHPLLFATISGAHLYGFPSADSDYDLRGAYVLPAQAVVGLEIGEETIASSQLHDNVTIDLETHDLKKFITLLLKKNGTVLEQLYSPLIIHSTPDHAELKTIAQGCITCHHVYHYAGFAATQWQLFTRQHPHRVKALLYVYRVLLTGIHLLRSGVVEANLGTLNQEFNLSYIPDLIARKVEGIEDVELADAAIAFHTEEYHRLQRLLDDASRASVLPKTPSAKAALHDFLVRVRLNEMTIKYQGI